MIFVRRLRRLTQIPIPGAGISTPPAAFMATVLLLGNVFQTDDVKGIEDHSITILIGDDHRSRREENEVGMRNAIFVAAGRHDKERTEFTRQPRPDVLDVHAPLRSLHDFALSSGRMLRAMTKGKSAEAERFSVKGQAMRQFDQGADGSKPDEGRYEREVEGIENEGARFDPRPDPFLPQRGQQAANGRRDE